IRAIIEWCAGFARARYSRRRGKISRRSLMVLKDEVHSDIARAFRTADALSGRLGSTRLALIVLLAKLDNLLFGATGLSSYRESYPWYVLLRTAFSRLGRRSPGRARTPSSPLPRTGLRILEG